ncbi:hypothetical protein [Rhizobium leguminosarum]|uniref:hypothetical protein n=1 Tax=Rhizobium leguminosarum TaxID=384 RepID=UPI001038CD10|nr:hypothetical protein [Rhizobium leguminosarum]TBY81703.1 hypothetical protein E0H32_15570 [Rhizobium leguminosarum bv. viciae]
MSLMQIRMLGLFLGLSLGSAVAYGQNGASPATVSFEVSAERLACLREHASVYRASDRKLLFIPLAECPNLPRRPVLSSLVNQGAGKPRDKSESGFIYVTKAEFECLIEAQPAPAQVYRFFPAECKLEGLQ